MTVFVTVTGVVQGVGYRPFVAGIARESHVSGLVRNSGGVVEIFASGPESAVTGFLRLLREHRPAGAVVLDVSARRIPERRFDGFSIARSGEKPSAEKRPPVFPPDLPVCGDCLREMLDPKDRRFRYPFISCASCGPRFSILDSLPYDRENTSMRDFPMCSCCAEEYRAGRRRHAQTISCRECGPQLLFYGRGGPCEQEEALRRGVALLKSGAVVAVKGVGGYQYVCLPGDARAVDRLRRLKGREKKPFAVMFSSPSDVRKVCRMSPEEEALISSAARPIVLLEKTGEAFCAGVCGDSRFLGAFLPSAGLHRLLTDACGPLVVTSGNATTEPIIHEDGRMAQVSSPLLGGVLYHTRAIRTPLDDSVARVFRGTPQVLRRSRGYVPLPVVLGVSAPRPALAAGGDLKSCFCLLSGDRAYLSQYFGDLENYRVQRNYRAGLERMERIFGIRPQAVACDLHPGYFSSALAKKIASGLPGGQPVPVQHHFAHAASVMAEHGLESCIGVVFDGTGYGTDGTVWGGEFLLCRGAGFKRAGCLSRVMLCGGDAAARDASLTADCYRFAAGEKAGGKNFPLVSAALSHRVNTFETSSMGRLFDAAAAILGIRVYNGYEGECPIALENAAVSALKAGTEPYPFRFRLFADESGRICADQTDFARQLLRAAGERVQTGAAALGFHRAVGRMVLEVCRRIREKSGEDRVALSGGVFANRLLLGDCCDRLSADGFRVYYNSAVPSNDGGISLGQAWVLAHAGQTGTD